MQDIVLEALVRGDLKIEAAFRASNRVQSSIEVHTEGLKLARDRILSDPEIVRVREDLAGYLEDSTRELRSLLDSGLDQDHPDCVEALDKVITFQNLSGVMQKLEAIDPKTFATVSHDQLREFYRDNAQTTDVGAMLKQLAFLEELLFGRPSAELEAEVDKIVPIEPSRINQFYKSLPAKIAALIEDRDLSSQVLNVEVCDETVRKLKAELLVDEFKTAEAYEAAIRETIEGESAQAAKLRALARSGLSTFGELFARVFVSEEGHRFGAALAELRLDFKRPLILEFFKAFATGVNA